MNKKKMKICLILVLVLIECISLTLTIKSFSNRNLEEIKEEYKVDNKKFSMYIQNDEGVYEPYENSNLFPEGYSLNLEKSNCVDTRGDSFNNILSSSNGKVTITSNKTVYCYLYFDITNDLEIEVYTDGTKGAMPSQGTYSNSATCTSGVISWNQKYQRIEIGSVTTSENECKLTFTKNTTTYTKLITEVQNKATTNANGYRYSGQNPDNYIWFNNEIWRIIGSIPTCLTANCGTNTTNLIKIIRNEPIGGASYDAKPYDSYYTAYWGASTLSKLLNEYYYGQKDGTESEYCYVNWDYSKSVCDYRHIGIKPTGYYGKMIKNVYWNTGEWAEGNTAATLYSYESARQSGPVNIGIMNISDYGYATTSTYHTYAVSDYSNSNINKNNWLFNHGGEWTMTQRTNMTVATIIGITNTGSAGNISVYNGGFMVRPVVYLDSSVYIISGTGKVSDPYIIGM